MLFFFCFFFKIIFHETYDKQMEGSIDRRLAIAQSREKCYCQTSGNSTKSGKCYYQTSGNSKISGKLLLPDTTGLMIALVGCTNA